MQYDKKSYLTPKGVFVYPKLSEPDTKFKEEGEYSTKVRVPDAEAANLVQEIDRRAAAALAEARENEVNAKKRNAWSTKYLPYEAEEDDDGNETGHILFKFKSKASGTTKGGKTWNRTIPVFDAEGTPMTGVDIWGGTVGRISFSFVPYAGTAAVTGASVSLQINAVQVIDLVEGGNRSADAFGFSREEGYKHPPEASKDDDSDWENDPDF